jgi:hypothetical protein
LFLLFLVSPFTGLAGEASTSPHRTAPTPKVERRASEILFKDDFEKSGSAIDTTKWRVSRTTETDVIEIRRGGWPNTGGYAVITDSGDRGGSYHGHASAIASRMSFRRGRNLRCTFRVAMPAHTGTGFSGPWHSTNAMTHEKYSMLNYMTGSIGFYGNGTDQPPHMEWDENNHDFDRNLPVNGYLNGPRLAQDFLRAWRYSAPAFGSGSAWITIRVWLGNTSGAFCEWSTDNGATWQPLRDWSHSAVIDTRGRTGVATDWGPAALSGVPVGVVNVNTTKDQFVAFGPAQGTVYIDDVVVERDAALAEVNVASPVVSATSMSTNPAGDIPVLERVTQQAKLIPAGHYVEVMVPDTLDLAARAELLLNALTHNSRPDDFHTVYESFNFEQDPPVMSKPGWFINPASLCATPYLRVMCGSAEGVDAELRMMKEMLARIQPDGRVTFPNDAGWPKGTSVPNVNGQLAVALLNWYERDKNVGWLDYVHLLCQGLDRMAVRIRDRAYYPLECGIDANGVWHWTNRGASVLPYSPPHEPDFEQQGYEGSAKWMTVFGPMEALAGRSRHKRDPQSFDLAMRLTRFGLKGPMWEGFSSLAYPGNQQGIFAGNFTGNVEFLNALLDVGMVQHSEALKQRARQGYELTRRVGVMRLGWYPSWIMNGSETYGRSKDLHGVCDNAGVAATLMLAVKLGDAGIGDYWDDVDYIVRNQLVEQQFVDANVMLRKAGGDPKNLIARFVGGCGAGEPSAIKPEISGVATAATAAAFYYAWHGITRYDQDSRLAQVNLFLNRVSPWLDVESYLPYQGKVVLRNKQASTILVRLPMWLNDRLPMWDADQLAVSCKCNGQSWTPARVGRNLLFDVHVGDVIELNFPVPTRTDKYTIHGKAYNIQFRGSTVMDIDNRNASPKMIPLYQREAMKGTTAPMRTIKRFVADRVLPLSVE